MVAIVVMLIVIAFDRDDGDAVFLQQSEPFDGVIHRLGRDSLFVKKIAAHQYEVDPAVDRVSAKHIHPRVEKIARAFSELIARTAEMHIGDMQKSHLHNFTIFALDFG